MVSYSRTLIMMVAASNNLALKAFAAKAPNSACFQNIRQGLNPNMTLRREASIAMNMKEVSRYQYL